MMKKWKINLIVILKISSAVMILHLKARLWKIKKEGKWIFRMIKFLKLTTQYNQNPLKKNRASLCHHKARKEK